MPCDVEDLPIPERDESAERRGVGTAHPHPVGLPALAAAAAQMDPGGSRTASRASTLGNTPQRTSGRPQRRVNFEPGQAATPPQTTARASEEEDVSNTDGNANVVRRAEEPIRRGPATKFLRVDLEIVAAALRADHREFWSDMSLAHFVATDWGCPLGNLKEMEEFLREYKKEDSTKVKGRTLDLSQKRLAQIFKIGEPKRRQAAQRVKLWASRKFTGPKLKNGYRLSECTDPAMVERIEFLRVTMYMQEKKPTVSGALAREVEEVQGATTDWANLFFKQFHHEVDSSRSTKKSIVATQIRLIINWYKEQFSKEPVHPIPANIPPSPSSPPGVPRIVAQPIPLETQVKFGVGPQPARKRALSGVDVGEAGNAPGPAVPPVERVVAPGATGGASAPQKRRRVAQRMESSGSDEEGEELPVLLPQPRVPVSGIALERQGGEGNSLPGYMKELAIARERGDS